MLLFFINLGQDPARQSHPAEPLLRAIAGGMAPGQISTNRGALSLCSRCHANQGPRACCLEPPAEPHFSSWLLNVQWISEACGWRLGFSGTPPPCAQPSGTGPERQSWGTMLILVERQTLPDAEKPVTWNCRLIHLNWLSPRRNSRSAQTPDKEVGKQTGGALGGVRPRR